MIQAGIAALAWRCMHWEGPSPGWSFWFGFLVMLMASMCAGCCQNERPVAFETTQGKCVVCLDVTGSVVDSLAALLDQIGGELKQLPITSSWEIGILPITGRTGVACAMIDTCSFARVLQSQNRGVREAALKEREIRVERMLEEVSRWCESQSEALRSDTSTCIMQTIECAHGAMSGDATIDQRIVLVSDLIEECPSDGIDLLKRPQSAESLSTLLQSKYPKLQLEGTSIKGIAVVGSPNSAAKAHLSLIKRCELWREALAAFGADSVSIRTSWKPARQATARRFE